MKKGIFILSLIIILTIALVGCETEKTNQENNKSDVTKLTEATNPKENSAIKPAETSDVNEDNTKVTLINYIGRWHIDGDILVGENEYDKELEITDINNSNVTFNLGFFRITGIYDVSAKIEGNIAKFNQAPISGTLEFYDNGILVSIDKSELEYIKTGKMDFNSKDKNMKQVYKDKLDTIQKQLSVENEQVVKEGNTDYGIATYAQDSFEQWDAALNEIYGILKQSLSSEDMKRLRTEEIQWVDQKEKMAKDTENEQGQGSQLGYVAYYSTSAKLTKDRCYELVDKYMK
jgi:Protein of unknown function (DUF1311).